MARMIPDTIHPSVRSGAERRLFHVIQNAPGTEDWVCLHSLGLARHTTKRRSEIDFLLITRKGIFVLEVKGGGISRHGGVWQFTDRYGDVHEKSESPFDQAATAMFALESDVRKKFEGNSRRARLLFGYGAMFPDIVFEELGTEADRRQLYDASDRRRPIIHFVDRLTAFARERDARDRYAPTAKDIEALVDFLRPDFDLIPSLGVRAAAAGEELVSLEKEQYAVIDAWEQYKQPRVLIEGSAGTGKTLLALETAVREARKAEGDVLLLCYNRLLAWFLDEKAKGRQPSGGIVVKSVYSLLNDLIDSSALAEEFGCKRTASDQNTVYRRLYPEYALLALLEAQIRPFKTLVIDEAQDMMTQELLDVLDAYVDGGLETGRWRIFCDVNNQASVFGIFDETALERLKRFGELSILVTNRRNTRPVADETTMLARPKITARATVSGIPVQYNWYAKADVQVRRLSGIIKRLLGEDVSPSRITVLSPRNIEDCCAASLSDSQIIPLTRRNIRDFTAGKCPSASYCTISSFKGLENDFIVLTDIEDLESEWWRSVIYVGMSRARVGLYVLLHESLRAVYETRLRQWLEEHNAEMENVG
jgi:Nuclease-related domain/Schlafen group 3, DNA/RNA helicase domain